VQPHRTLLPLLASAMVAVALLLPAAPAAAAPPVGAVYEGATSAGGTVRIVVTADQSVTVTVQHPGVGFGCPASSLTVQAVALAANGSQLTINAAPASDGVASMSGFFALPGSQAVAGAFSDRPASGCAPRAATWSARRLDPPVAPEPWPYAAGVQHEGVAYDVTGTPLGTADGVTDAAGRVTVTISAVQGNCVYRAAPATAGGSDRPTGPLLEITGGAGRVALVTSLAAMGGGFVVEATSPACPALAGMWIARAPAPAAPPAATPPTGGPGRFASPPAFGSGFTALAVFGGGTVAQLEAAAREAAASGVWAQDGAGRFLLLVVDGPAFINEPFRAAFGAGLPASTAVTLAR